MKLTLALAVSLTAVTMSAAAVRADGVVTIYSADGLHDGTPNWYQTEFDAFTKATGHSMRWTLCLPVRLPGAATGFDGGVAVS